MSIFDKDCPLCGSKLSVSADGCECGFSFEPDSIVETAQDLEIAVQDEQLYANYLSARVMQTREAIDSAKILLEREPENPALQNGVKNAEEECEAACSENNAQIKKLAIVEKMADEAKETALKASAVIDAQQAEAKAKAEAMAEKEAEEARLRAIARAQVARENTAKEEARAKQATEKQARLIKKQAQEILEQDEEKSAKRARRAARAAHERQVAMAMALVSRTDDDIKQARRYTSAAIETDLNIYNAETKVEKIVADKSKPAKKIDAAVVVSSTANKKRKSSDQALDKIHQQLAQERSSRAPVIAKKPNLVFKARQAIKAAAALMRKADTKGPDSLDTSETQSTEILSSTNVTPIAEKLTKLATPEFKSQQRRNTDRLQTLPKLAHNAPPTCPHCTAEIDTRSNKCKCGFVLEPINADGLGLVLSAADKEAMDAFSYISITKMS